MLLTLTYIVVLANVWALHAAGRWFDSQVASKGDRSS
jgi:hypothetical protein